MLSSFRTASIKVQLRDSTKARAHHNTSLDYLVFDNQPRRPLDAPTNLLEARLPETAELAEDDQRALLDHLDALLTRTRLHAITGRDD